MPSNQRFEFTNRQGVQLSAALTLPDREARGYVLFAHCFTCGKNISAASRLSRFLAGHGMGVLRFDFTGIGNSEGDFGNTNFASNVADLVDAANHMRETLAAPNILIGHSLGGAAVLAAAAEVPECRAVVTLGAPASPSHVVDRLGRGDGSVVIGDERFLVDQEFVSQYDPDKMNKLIGGLRRALLVLHAPLDDTVPVSEAATIFQSAKHPKSFISLDDADHLLSRSSDVEYIAQTIASWVIRYLPDEEAVPLKTVAAGKVYVGEVNQKFLRQVNSDDHGWVADEPTKMGGQNLGPDPYEHLLAALGTCTSMTIRMYANRKQWPLSDVDILLTHSREHAQDCEDCETTSSRIEVLERIITLHGDLTDVQRERLLQIADRCPVHKTIESDIQIRTALTE